MTSDQSSQGQDFYTMIFNKYSLFKNLRFGYTTAVTQLLTVPPYIFASEYYAVNTEKVILKPYFFLKSYRTTSLWILF